MSARKFMLAGLVCLCAVTGALSSAVASAQAAPETPLLEVATRRATEVQVLGVLYPGAVGEAGNYEFLYKQSTSECEGGSRAPVPPGLATGLQFEVVTEVLSGLLPGKPYTICLSVSNGKETTLSAPVTVTTALPLETPGQLRAEAIAARSATLGGVLNPGTERKAEPGSYEFLYRRSATECEGESASSSIAAAGATEEAVSAPVAELLPHTTYAFCLRATNEAGESARSAVSTFTTLAAAPKVEEASVNDVTDSSATLQARINPDGDPTTYVFEYAPAGGTFAPVAEAEGRGGLGEGDTGVTISVHTQTGLAVDTAYQFRVVASNAVGTDTGAAVSFTTQPLGSAFSLLDARVWELVTPANKHGANIGVQGENCCALQVAEDGSRFSDVAFSPLEEEPAGNTYGVQFFSQRAAAGGWSTKDISTRDEKAIPTPIGEGSEYRIFSSDLSSSVVQPFGKTLLSEDAIELNPEFIPRPVSRTTYLRDDATGTFEPLVTKQNVSPMVHFGNAEFVGANPTLTSVVFTSGEPLTGASGGLFDWKAGHLSLIAEGGELGGRGDYQNAISGDGTHVVWSTNSGIYDTNVATGEVVDVAVGENLDYQFASADGSRVFLTGESLTPDSHHGHDLYEYDLETGALSDITASLNLGEGAGVASLLGASEDGSYIYFLATGSLAAGATPGENNLYVAHGGGSGWTATFIAALDNEDGKDWASPPNRTSRVSPNGLYLAFMSDRGLTGYDNRDAVSGEPDEEVFLYSAATNQLRCPSCNPTGARPHGLRVESSNFEPSLIDGQSIQSGRWLAAAVPAWTHYDLTETDYQSRYLSNSGRLFFDGVDSLVPQDTNSKTDVYEYEPGATGSCAETDGCVSLVSNGTSNEESVFLDASANGDDIFFLTKAKLVPEDTDTAFDVYDAHVCSEAAPCTPQQLAPPACTTAEACRAAETPQPAIYGSPASETFSGAGNVASTAGQGEVVKPSGGAVKPAAGEKRAKAPRRCEGKRKQGKQKRVACKQRRTGRKVAAKRSRKANANRRSEG